MNKRQNTNLFTYMQNRGIKPEYVMEKTNEEVNSSQQLRYWYKNCGDMISLEQLRELCNVIFILKDVVYVSEDMIIEKIFGLRQIKKSFESYGKRKKRDLEEFLKKGTIIIDVNDFENNAVVFMDWDNYIIAIIDKFNYIQKMNTKVIKAELLDENDDNISDELYEKFFGAENTEDSNEVEDQTEKERYDDEYFDLEDEYGDAYGK